MSSASSPNSRPERRASDRRSGADRRGNQRRAVADRRYSSDRRNSPAFRANIETPIEHIRNAMQVLIGTIEYPEPLTSDEFALRAVAALERLTRALAALEGERRR
jgi:hypothetical protein